MCVYECLASKLQKMCKFYIFPCRSVVFCWNLIISTVRKTLPGGLSWEYERFPINWRVCNWQWKWENVYEIWNYDKCAMAMMSWWFGIWAPNKYYISFLPFGSRWESFWRRHWSTYCADMCIVSTTNDTFIFVADSQKDEGCCSLLMMNLTCE